MNKKDDNKELKTRVLDCFKTLVENYDFKHEFTNYRSGTPNYPIKGFHMDDKSKIEELMDLAVRLVFKMDNSVDELVENEVYTEDLVVISIDGGEPERYYLTRYTGRFDSPLETLYGYVEYNCDELSADSELGQSLLGRHVGQEFKYTNDDDKKEHTVKILSCRKTINSLKVNEEEIKADINYEKNR